MLKVTTKCAKPNSLRLYAIKLNKCIVQNVKNPIYVNMTGRKSFVQAVEVIKCVYTK